MARTIADLNEGEEATIVAVAGRGRLRYRLLELGLIKGARVRLVGQAPLGDPLEIRLGGALVALRREEARQIRVETA